MAVVVFAVPAAADLQAPFGRSDVHSLALCPESAPAGTLFDCLCRQIRPPDRLVRSDLFRAPFQEIPGFVTSFDFKAVYAFVPAVDGDFQPEDRPGHALFLRRSAFAVRLCPGRRQAFHPALSGCGSAGYACQDPGIIKIALRHGKLCLYGGNRFPIIGDGRLLIKGLLQSRGSIDGQTIDRRRAVIDQSVKRTVWAGRRL